MRFSGGRVNVSERHVNLWCHSRAAHVRSGLREIFTQRGNGTNAGCPSDTVSRRVRRHAMIHVAGRRRRLSCATQWCIAPDATRRDVDVDVDVRSKIVEHLAGS